MRFEVSIALTWDVLCSCSIMQSIKQIKYLRLQGLLSCITQLSCQILTNIVTTILIEAGKIKISCRQLNIPLNHNPEEKRLKL